jgi:hypothetical protein
MNRRRLLGALAALAWLAAAGGATAQETARRTENVLWVMMDGLRWQEVFAGADDALVDRLRGGVADVEDVKRKFVRESAEERRRVLLPFLWNVVAKEGQIYGNGLRRSVATVTNGLYFSYPGYNEVLCGYPDEWVQSNDKIYNRNKTVLEWLHEKPAFAGKVAAFTSWEVFPYIINDKRSGITVNSGFTPLADIPQTPEVELLNKLIVESPLYGEQTRGDALTFRAAMEYVKAKKPRVLFLSFDETDTQGHAGRYDRVLASARKNDAFVQELWETVQQMPEYRGKTSLVVTTDHGRGDPPIEWRNHSKKIAGSEYIWAAFMGPDTPATGERRDVEPITQSQIAATVAALLGYDYPSAQPKAGKPIAEVLGAPSGD